MKNIIFIAPPAAGKGTISDILVKDYNYEHLSTGDLLREEIKSGSSFGQEINDIISKGELVSDEIVIKLVTEKLNFLKDKAFILDGFPRTLNQAIKLDEMLITLGVTNNLVAYLDIDLDTALKRVLGRVICPKCKRSYNVYNEGLKPKNENICDDCNVLLEKRSDDTEETFKVRFNSYLENVNPIIEYYKEKGIYKSFLANGDPKELAVNIIKEANND